MRLLNIIVFIVIMLSGSSLHAQNGNFENYIPITSSGITIFLKQDLEVKPSTLRLGEDSAYKDFGVTWYRPEFDSDRYTIQSNQALLQELNEAGDWITFSADDYSASTSQQTNYTVRGKAPGVHEYRLYRSFYLKNKNTQSVEHIEYLEESKKTVVWKSAALPRINTWPSIITIPASSSNGDIAIQFDEPSSFKFKTGDTYGFVDEETSVEYTLSNLTSGVTTKGRFSFEDHRDGVIERTDLAPGTYEITSKFSTDIEFNDPYRILRELGLLDAEASSDDYRTDFAFVDDKPKTFLILPSSPQQLSKQIDQFGSALVSWEQVHHGVTFELQLFDEESNEWQEIYSGNKTHYLVTNLAASDSQIRVRACFEQGCGAFSQVVELEVDTIESTHCTPFEIDESFQ